MEVWKTVKVRRKDPGGPGGGQEVKKKAEEVPGAPAEADSGGIYKIRAEYWHNGRNGAFKASAEAKQLSGHLMRIDTNIVFKTEKDCSVTFSKMTEFPTGNKFSEFFGMTSILYL